MIRCFNYFHKATRFAAVLLCAVVPTTLCMPLDAWAEIPAQTEKRELTDADRMFLARQFLAKIKPTFDAANKQINKKRAETDVSNLPDGEELFLKIRLTPQLALDYQLLAAAEKGRLVLSFRDFVDAVGFPIDFDSKTGIAEGWYIREAKTFSLNTKTREVISDKGTFKMSEAVSVTEDDVRVPADELGKWFGIELKPNVPQLEVKLVSAVKLPIQEKLEREGRSLDNASQPTPSLPPIVEDQKLIDFPFVDVATESQYRRPGQSGAKPTTTSFTNIKTAGDFAKGTLTTQSQFSKDDSLTNLRATYKKESLEPELLGPLKARKFELGDVTTISMPVVERSSAGQGARVTNRDPLRTVTGAYTDITGSATPGWDVELYRGSQFLGIQTVGDDGRYTFPKVDLFGSDNTFRVVLYGSQGEIREEEVYIPVDNKRLADAGSAYDLSVVRQDTTTYRKFKSKDKDEGAPSVTALYELPVGEASALTAGMLTRQSNGIQKATGIAGLSTTFAETLWNFNSAVDNEGEMAGEIITRKDIGLHQLRNEMRVATDKFGYEEPDEQDNINAAFTGQGPLFDREAFGNEFNVNGPLDLNIGTRPYYNGVINYSQSAEGLQAVTGVAGFSTTFNPVSFNQQFVYLKTDAAEEDTLNTLTNVAGAIGRNRIRFNADYQIVPENELKRVGLNVNHYISPKMDAEAEIQHITDPKLTEISTRLNWDTGYGNLSPGLSYNTDNDVVATLSTRFGLAREPRDGSPKIFDRQITTNGGVSAFVFLDKNGDNVFNEGDEPIENAVIKAPQNGGRETTDEKGQAFFSHMGQLRLTDVYVDPTSLADPYWIPGYEGASVLPREGHIITIEFPVHMSGELDGTVFAQGDGDTTYPLKGVSVGLYDQTGKKIQGVTSEQDGYYILSKIPPGNYFLMVDEADFVKDAARPLPQLVSIGYEGTTIYANNIYLQQGAVDVPLSVLAKGLPYDAEKTKPYEGRNFALNLGEYKSRLAMGLAWFKIRALSGFAVKDAELIEQPAESFPLNGQKYVLRASVKDTDLASAYKRCGTIVQNGNYCSVEILSGGLAQVLPVEQKISSSDVETKNP